MKNSKNKFGLLLAGVLLTFAACSSMDVEKTDCRQSHSADCQRQQRDFCDNIENKDNPACNGGLGVPLPGS